MNSVTTPRFWQLYYQLPATVRQEAREAYRRFQADPSHPGLYCHRLFGEAQFWSVRVTRDYRAVAILRGNTITWIWIGSHQDFDRAFPR
jgi:hypothetical protein